MNVRSLRGRLGLLFTLGTVCITLVAAFFVALGQWNEERSQVLESVNLAAFELSESTNPDQPDLTGIRGVDVFALVFDADGQVLSSTGTVNDDLRLVVEEAIFAYVDSQEFVGYTFAPEDQVADVLFGELIQELTLDELRETAPDDFVYVDIRGEIISDEQLESRFTDGATIHASGVDCGDQTLCNTVVVGASEQSRNAYLSSNWLSILVPPLVAGLLALLASRWLVGRALRPVDEMRAELENITASNLKRRVPVPSTGDELEELGSSMNRTIARLESALTANERFVADAAHELRSPITGVRAALEVESNRPTSGPAGDPAIGSSLIGDSLTELDRASRLIDDLLVIARRQGVAATKHDVDLDDIVRSEMATMRTRFPAMSIAASIQPARLSGDGDALRRVVTNLMENACLYGNGRLEVSLESSDDHDGPRLVVEDDGPGIPPAERTRVFERFARLDESRARSTGGSGLGLAIASEIVEDHGGSIVITDGALGGARFEVALPTL